MYYPKSQITPNLYTNGNEFVLSTTQEVYSGFYYKVSTGKFYTGRNQDDKPNVELLPLITSQTISTPTQENFQSNYITTTSIFDANNETYLNIKSQQPTSKFIPTYLPETPTQQDYQVGEFRRYFCKKTNQIQYIEINQEQFDQLVAQDPQIEFSLYLPFFIDWQLTGNEQQVARINKNSVELISFQQKLPNLNQYLRFDYTKYYQ
jgi:hypothetical protein